MTREPCVRLPSIPFVNTCAATLAVSSLIQNSVYGMKRAMTLRDRMGMG